MCSLELVKIICDALARLPPSIWLGTGKNFLFLPVNIQKQANVKKNNTQKYQHANKKWNVFAGNSVCALLTVFSMHVQVRDAAQAIDPGLVAIACGSYRRGKATCGDVDVLISHPDGKSHRGIFTKVLQTLRDSGKHHFC